MTDKPQGGLNLLRLEPRIKVLHLTWLAFFVSFVVWFNHAPLIAAIRTSLNLTDQEVSALLILNVALTIPARIVIGMLVDKLGPRLVYSLLLAISGALCVFFGLAQDFATLAVARFLLAFVGAGFVVGIRMIGEWFPAKEAGFAQGIYAGLGNFGSAAAAVTLPTIALLFGGPDGWRWAVILTGVIAMLYAVIYYLSVSDTPKGSTYFKPKKTGAMEVTSRGGLRPLRADAGAAGAGARRARLEARAERAQAHLRGDHQCDLCRPRGAVHLSDRRCLARQCRGHAGRGRA